MNQKNFQYPIKVYYYSAADLMTALKRNIGKWKKLQRFSTCASFNLLFVCTGNYNLQKIKWKKENDMLFSFVKKINKFFYFLFWILRVLNFEWTLNRCWSIKYDLILYAWLKITFLFFKYTDDRISYNSRLLVTIDINNALRTIFRVKSNFNSCFILEIRQSMKWRRNPWRI